MPVTLSGYGLKGLTRTKFEMFAKHDSRAFCFSCSFFSDFCAIISRNKSLDFIKASAILTIFLYQSHVGWRLEENCFNVIITSGIKSPFNKKSSSHLWNAFFNSIVFVIFLGQCRVGSIQFHG